MDQISLARELERLGADVLQTEGGSHALSEDHHFLSPPSEKSAKEMIEMAIPAIVAAFQLSRAVSIPVICASGSLTEATVPIVLFAGLLYLTIFY
jgi:hypothetical protein